MIYIYIFIYHDFLSILLAFSNQHRHAFPPTSKVHLARQQRQGQRTDDVGDATTQRLNGTAMCHCFFGPKKVDVSNKNGGFMVILLEKMVILTWMVINDWWLFMVYDVYGLLMGYEWLLMMTNVGKTMP